MASLQTSSLLFSSPSRCSSSNRTINAAIHVPKLPRVGFTVPKQTTKLVLEGLQLKEQVLKHENIDLYNNNQSAATATPTVSTAQLYALLEAVADRVEMHANIGEQRNNWNALLLSSINMITLSASLMAGVNAAAGTSVLALNISSAILFSAATGMLLIMNKIQPSQLAEEQRNATRLFRQLQSEIETVFALRDPTEKDVKETMEKVLALDKAYPLPLLGAMLEKFPKKFEPAVWWPRNVVQSQNPRKLKSQKGKNMNGWSEELESEMREIIQVVKSKDIEDYERLGSLVLKINKILAVSGPVLTGIAAVGSAFVGHGSATAAVAAVAAGSLASIVNAFQHGAQVGMVFEMYRNCAGFFNKLEDSIEATLGEQDLEKRENGGIFEMKVAMQLGRSLEQLRELASKSALYRSNGEPIDEFGCKLF